MYELIRTQIRVPFFDREIIKPEKITEAGEPEVIAEYATREEAEQALAEKKTCVRECGAGDEIEYLAIEYALRYNGNISCYSRLAIRIVTESTMESIVTLNDLMSAEVYVRREPDTMLLLP